MSNSISTLISASSISNVNLRTIRDWHKDNKFELFVICDKLFERIALQCQIKDEYLDFLLVDSEVIFGFMNDNHTYKTITASDKYTLFVKDSKDELKSYKKFVVELKKQATEITNFS